MDPQAGVEMAASYRRKSFLIETMAEYRECTLKSSEN